MASEDKKVVAEDGGFAGDELVRASIVHDPFAGKNPMHIAAHPAGKRLYWLNPRFREHYGMRGFQFVKYSDAIGRNLTKYIPDPPSKMEGSAHRDDFVRRGDSILGWIPIGVWEARQERRTDRAGKKLTDANKSGRDKGLIGQGMRLAKGFVLPEDFDSEDDMALESSKNSRSVRGREMMNEKD